MLNIPAAQLQHKSGKSHEEHIVRITAPLTTIAKAMVVAAMEQKRRLRERTTKYKMRL